MATLNPRGFCPVLFRGATRQRGGSPIDQRPPFICQSIRQPSDLDYQPRRSAGTPANRPSYSRGPKPPTLPGSIMLAIRSLPLHAPILAPGSSSCSPANPSAAEFPLYGARERPSSSPPAPKQIRHLLSPSPEIHSTWRQTEKDDTGTCSRPARVPRRSPPSPSAAQANRSSPSRPLFHLTNRIVRMKPYSPAFHAEPQPAGMK